MVRTAAGTGWISGRETKIPLLCDVGQKKKNPARIMIGIALKKKKRPSDICKESQTLFKAKSLLLLPDGAICSSCFPDPAAVCIVLT